MRAGRGEGEVAAALRPLSRVRLLHVHAVQRAFGGFDSAAGARKFARRAAPLLGRWCCRPNDDKSEGGESSLSGEWHRCLAVGKTSRGRGLGSSPRGGIPLP